MLDFFKLEITEDHRKSQVKAATKKALKPSSKVTDYQHRVHLVPNVPFEIADKQFVIDYFDMK